MGNLGLTDVPLESRLDEALGVSAHIDALTKFISECNTPMTIAIQGDWGTGKTSMMNLVRAGLEKSKIECIWFNTWQFSQFKMQDDVPVALLLELLKSVCGEDSKFAQKIIGGLKTLSRGIVMGLSSMFGAKEVGEGITQNFTASPLDVFAQVRGLRENIQEAINEKLKNGKQDRIVIFVDDLDRMNPGKAVELLEVIKNFLDLKNCVFVLAVDYGVVSAGTKQKYGADMDELKGRSFFDKIIQLPFNLPVSQYTINKYLQKILALKQEELRVYLELATYSIGTNPRALKRLANIMNLLELLAKNNDPEISSQPEFKRLLFAILCLQLAYEPVYTGILLEDDPAGFIKLSSEERKEFFAGPLAKCPGRKEELADKFENFIEALIGAIPQKNHGEADLEFFTGVLAMSGLTASGNTPVIAAEKIKKSFDPALLNQINDRCALINKKYQSFWSLLDNEAAFFQDKDASLVLPVAFEKSICLQFRLTNYGIEPVFYSANASKGVKNQFYKMLQKMAPNMEKFNPGVARFISFPSVEWLTAADKKSAEASMDRARQLGNVLEKFTAQILPGIEAILSENAVALNALENFISRIKNRLETLFPIKRGWEIRQGTKGLNFMNWTKTNFIIGLGKNFWKDEVMLTLANLNNSIFIGLKKAHNDNYAEDARTRALEERWLSSGPALSGKEFKYPTDFAFGAYLPEQIGKWTSGKYFASDLKYLLNEEKEKLVLEAIEAYAKTVLDMEEEIDLWAEKEN